MWTLMATQTGKVSFELHGFSGKDNMVYGLYGQCNKTKAKSKTVSEFCMVFLNYFLLFPPFDQLCVTEFL